MIKLVSKFDGSKLNTKIYKSGKLIKQLKHEDLLEISKKANKLSIEFREALSLSLKMAIEKWEINNGKSILKAMKSE